MTQNAKPAIFWDNLLARSGAVLSATSSEPGHPVANLADWREYLTWRSADSAAQNLTVDCGSAQAASACLIYRHNIFSSGRSQATLYGSTNGVNWTQIFQQAVGSDDVFFKSFAQVSYRFYKLNINAGGSPAEIAILFLGNFLEFPSWPAAGFDPNQSEALIENSKSEEGYLLGVAVRYFKRRVSLCFDRLSDDFARNTLLPFWKSHVPKPFLFAWDRTNHPLEIYLMEVSEPKLDLPYGPVHRALKLELEGRVQ